VNKYLTEFIGTFGLVLTIGCAALAKAALAPVAIGAALMVMIYAGGHVSGGHFNPAVSLAAFVRGRLDSRDLLTYWGSQLVGGTIAAGLALYLRNPGDLNPARFTGRQIGTAFVAELIFTFFLAYVVLNVATSKDHPNNSFYGLAIGFTVLAGAVAVGDISGGAFNPAVALGISIMGLTAWANIWIYVVACLAGGAFAGVVFRIQNPDDV